MKKTITNVMVAGTLMALVLGLSGCGTTKVISDPVNKVEVGSDDEVDKVVVVDWTDRTLGEIAVPTWLKNMRRGNSDTFKEQWGLVSVNSSLSYSSHSPRILNGVISMFHGKSFCQSCSVWA